MSDNDKNIDGKSEAIIRAVSEKRKDALRRLAER